MVKCNLCNRQFKTAQALAQHRQASHRAPVPPTRPVPRTQQPRRVAAPPNRDGELVIGREELVLSAAVPAGEGELNKAIPIKPEGEVLSWLLKLAANFDQIEWQAIRLVWKPAVGTTFNGSLIVGADWNAEATESTRAKAQACVPHFDTPIWQRGGMVLPKDRLQSRARYVLKAREKVDQSPGVILFAARTSKIAEETFIGDLWMEYRVRLMGPTA